MTKNILIILFIPAIIFSQKQGKGKNERSWAIFHPIAAIKVKKIYNQGLLIYNNRLEYQKYLDTFNSGGKLDAFKHAFFMAAFAQKVGVNKLRKLGCAHEKDNYSQYLKLRDKLIELPDSMSTVMDLKNNEIGLNIGAKNKNISLSDIKVKVIDKIKTGKCFILKRNSSGIFVDCNNNILEFNKFPSSWGNLKCIVATDLPPD